MALNQEYFDAIHIDVVKKKYYNANKVEAVFKDIKEQALVLDEENRQLRAQLEVLNNKKFEIGDAVLSAQAIYREIVEKAKQRAEQIIAEAEGRKAEIIQETLQQQEYAVQRVENCYARMKEQHMAAIEAINAEWQDFLCGLFVDDEVDIQSAIPADLSEKVGAIAQELFSMENEE